MVPANPPKVVLVTGAARRLGRQIALTLAQSGWQVAVHTRTMHPDAMETVAACADLTGVGAAFDADLSDSAATHALVPRVLAHFGQLDAVVNSAALFEHDDATSFAPELLQRHLASNTVAPVLLAQALHQHVQTRQARGVVVNLLDQKLWNLNPDFFSYTLSKAALHTATTMLALALAPHTRVLAVAPGLTLTSHLLTPERFAALHKLAPLGRSSTPEDVAAAVRFALDNESMTGSTLMVDGGQHLMRLERDFSLL